MRRILVKTKKILTTFKESIAFYPALMGVGGFVFATFMLFLESHGVSDYMTQNFPYFVLQNSDTGKTMMSVLAAGIISIMVFSFSQVMVLLNQASSQYSPRVLPGLISKRSHQYILGLYVASIVYNIFILMGIEPDGKEYLPPGFSVILGILFTIICLFAFIYFVNSMSKSIQIHSILDHIFTQGFGRLQMLIDAEEEEPNITIVNDDHWHTHYSKRLGYFVINSEQNLFEYCVKNGFKLRILPIEGDFVHKNQALYESSRELNEREVNIIDEYFSLVKGEFVPENYVLAFKQMTEVGIKAMSPGINDPGTAVNTIDYITELLSLRMRKRDTHHFINKKEVILSIQVVQFQKLLYQILVPFRTYAQKDMTCNQKLMIMFQHLLHQNTQEAEYLTAIWQEAQNYYLAAKEGITHPADVAVLDRMFGDIQKLAEKQLLVM